MEPVGNATESSIQSFSASATTEPSRVSSYPVQVILTILQYIRCEVQRLETPTISLLWKKILDHNPTLQGEDLSAAHIETLKLAALLDENEVGVMYRWMDSRFLGACFSVITWWVRPVFQDCWKLQAINSLASTSQGNSIFFIVFFFSGNWFVTTHTCTRRSMPYTHNKPPM